MHPHHMTVLREMLGCRLAARRYLRRRGVADSHPCFEGQAKDITLRTLLFNAIYSVCVHLCQSDVHRQCNMAVPTRGDVNHPMLGPLSCEVKQPHCFISNALSTRSIGHTNVLEPHLRCCCNDPVLADSSGDMAQKQLRLHLTSRSWQQVTWSNCLQPADKVFAASKTEQSLAAHLSTGHTGDSLEEQGHKLLCVHNICADDHVKARRVLCQEALDVLLVTPGEVAQSRALYDDLTAAALGIGSGQRGHRLCQNAILCARANNAVAGRVAQLWRGLPCIECQVVGHGLQSLGAAVGGHDPAGVAQGCQHAKRVCPAAELQHLPPCRVHRPRVGSRDSNTSSLVLIPYNSKQQLAPALKWCQTLVSSRCGPFQGCQSHGRCRIELCTVQQVG